MPRVETNYVTETQTAIQTQLETNTADDASFTLVGKNDFIDLFNQEYSGADKSNIAPQLLWDEIIGDHPWCAAQGISPDVHYLTKESASLIFKHLPLFKSGLDYQHLPKGFFRVKNPNGAGIRDVLHYSDVVASRQAHISPLAITVSDKNVQESKNPQHFAEAKACWYDFLCKKMTGKNGNILCTQQELDDAFVLFVKYIASKNLKFYETDFAEIRGDVNPIVLLGRWHTVLSNPHLKQADLEKQWQVLSNRSFALS